MKLGTICRCVLFAILFYTPALNSYNLLIFDTAQRHKVFFVPFTNIAQSVGFDRIDYAPIATIADKSDHELQLKQYDAVLFFFSNEFLETLPVFMIKKAVRSLPRNLQQKISKHILQLPPQQAADVITQQTNNLPKTHIQHRRFLKNIAQKLTTNQFPSSPLSKKILRLFKFYNQLPGKLVGVILPGMRTNIAQLNLIFRNLEVTQYHNTLTVDDKRKRHDTEKVASLPIFTHLTNLFLSNPLPTRTAQTPQGTFPMHPYHTTLFPQTIKQPFLSPLFTYAQKHNLPFYTPIYHPSTPLHTETKLAPLPINDPLHKEDFQARATLPQGIYWHNPLHNNHIFIAPEVIFTFAGINENFRFTPFQTKLNQQLHTIMQQIMFELANALKNGTGINTQTAAIQTRPPLPKIFDYIGSKPIFPEHHHPIKCGWIEINPFADTTKEEQQKAIIRDIVESKLTHVWLPIKPNIAYSPRGQTANKEKILKQLASFSSQLLKQSIDKQTKPPKLLIGIELNWNLYEPHLPPAGRDIYGNEYYDMPSPLNTNFWYDEVITPLTKLLKDIDEYNITLGLPIAGIVLDLEFYTRRTISCFLSTMGFSHEILTKFGASNMRTLTKNKTMQKYVSFLSHQAKKLGNDLRTSIQTIIPNGIIGCYVPTINPHWFFQGFFAGLSSKEIPLLLCTFNTEYALHQKWLENKNIFTQHLSVLMLSKLNGKNFKLVDTIFERHHGVWLNKIGSNCPLEKNILSAKDNHRFNQYLKKL